MAGEQSDTRVPFGDLLRRHRVAAGLSQEALAERARMSARAISDLERGVHRAPYRDTRAQLAAALGLGPAERAALEAAASRPHDRFPAGQPPDGTPGDLLMLTKLAIPPPRPALVPRPRLTERLQAGLRGPLTLLSAPAGCGKTTLLCAWCASAARDAMPVAWVSLDAADNDPVRFWSYALHALDRLAPGACATALTLLQSARPPHMESLLAGALNGLMAVPGEMALVLDDYHLIETHAIHQAVAFLLDHLPPRLHLVIATRADPPLPLARLRARGAVTEVRAADLRCTTEEATAFLTGVMGLSLTEDDVTALTGRTEGWMAGLQLAALSLHDRPAASIAPFIAAFAGSNRYVADYLVDEVLAYLPREMQTFLLDTCVLDRLCASLCAVVTGAGDGQTDRAAECQGMLEALERANVFVIALDDERQWYRYHQLFAEVLRHRLRRTRADLWPELHRRASLWYERQGDVAGAVQHALAAADGARAADLVEWVAQASLERGEVATLRGWLEALPGEVVRARPRLSLAFAWVVLFADQLGVAEAYARDTERLLAASAAAPHSADVAALLGEAAVLQAEVAMSRGDFPRTIERCRQALDLLGEDQPALQSMVSLILGSAHRRSGDVTAAGQAYADAIRLAQAAGHTLYLLLASTNLSGLLQSQGRLHQAAATHRHALRHACDVAGTPLPLACMAYVGLGGLFREWNDLDAATDQLQTGIGLARQAGMEGVLLEGKLVLALVLQARGQAERARQLALQAFELARHWGATTVAQVASMEARFSLMQGQLEPAVRWAEESGLHVEDDLSEMREFEYLALARVLIARGRAQSGAPYIGQAASLLVRLLQAAETAGRTGRVIEVLSLQALVRQIQGDPSGAMAALERALALAEPEGYVRLFVDEGAPMAALLRQARARGMAPGYVRTLLAACGDQDAAEGLRAGHAPPARRGDVLAEPLSERERDVLRLLAAGLSNPEIARQLYVEASTVKTHLKSIYGKLAVHGREQAVARARELHLLST